MSYANPRYSVIHQHRFTGNDASTLLITPLAGTANAPETRSFTCEPWNPGRAITLKKLSYQVKTPRTDSGSSLEIEVHNVDVNNGDVKVGSLVITGTAANGIVTMPADLDSKIAADGYVVLVAKSTTTAANENSAIGQASITYQETYCLTGDE